MIDQEKVREILSNAGLDVEVSEGDFGKPFLDIGLDSLDVFNFLSEIEIAYGKSFSEEEFAAMNCIDDVIVHLKDK